MTNFIAHSKPVFKGLHLLLKRKWMRFQDFFWNFLEPDCWIPHVRQGYFKYERPTEDLHQQELKTANWELGPGSN